MNKDLYLNIAIQITLDFHIINKDPISRVIKQSMLLPIHNHHPNNSRMSSRYDASLHVVGRCDGVVHISGVAPNNCDISRETTIKIKMIVLRHTPEYCHMIDLSQPHLPVQQGMHAQP